MPLLVVSGRDGAARVAVDAAALAGLSSEYRSTIATISRDLCARRGPFNFAHRFSREVLFERLKIPVKGLRKGQDRHLARCRRDDGWPAPSLAGEDPRASCLPSCSRPTSTRCPSSSTETGRIHTFFLVQSNRHRHRSPVVDRSELQTSPSGARRPAHPAASCRRPARC